MADKLAPYHRKRDFKHTPEPRGTVAGRHRSLSFVIQKHAARRLHYDFRLELDGTLKSWAVPKGPSLDPDDKRLAVHVEDHPLEYGKFEGVIPEGHYGAGNVQIWDRGTWTPIGDAAKSYRAGKIKFQLDGEKLHGGWTLVRTRLPGSGDKEQWLLIKERDEVARSAKKYSITEALPDSVIKQSGKKPRVWLSKETGAKPKTKPSGAVKAARKANGSQPARTSAAAASLDGARMAAQPATFKPQLATLVESVPADGDWSYEIKFDGYRLLARVAGDSVKLITRNGKDWTAKMPALARAIGDLGLRPAWLDGEIVVQGANQVPSFQALQNAFDNEKTESIQYFVFDLPYYDGYDLTGVALRERRALLQGLLKDGAKGPLRFSEDFQEAPDRILDTACKLSLEGVIGKRSDAVYESRRSRNWIKLKCQRRQEFVIVGYTDPKGSRAGFGALLLAVHEKDGVLRYAGRVGTGFDERNLASLYKKLRALEAKRAPFAQLPPGQSARDVHWIKPSLVAEISFAEWTGDGIVRHAVFQGLRSDKPARDIGIENPAPAVDAKPEVKKKTAREGKTSTRRAETVEDELSGVRITHPDRVIDKDSGFTKLDLARYYEKIAPWILPHLKDRPVALVRAPDGAQGELFFQKHAEHMKIPGIRLLDPKFDPGHPALMVIDSVKALVGTVQMGTIELHTWNGTTRSADKPDQMIFDLDPDPVLKWDSMVDGAKLTRSLLQELGLDSNLKTSGGKGLHIVVPLARRDSWDDVFAFAQAVTRHLATTLPDRFSAKMGPKNRVKKIFVDYLRNRRGSSTVAAYSARARPGLPVSVPIGWKELDRIESSTEWNIESLPQRVDSMKQDPWAAGAEPQSLTAAMKKRLGLK
ncbi:MAG TPA: DNA ligase D [Burkholderiales bacterium]|nr:DNA ligase D [Burkholderiales bacterium]